MDGEVELVGDVHDSNEFVDCLPLTAKVVDVLALYEASIKDVLGQLL